MTNIFSSKQTEALKEAKAENAKLQALVVDMTAKLGEFNALKESMKTDKANFESAIETMKNEFTAVINALKAEVKALTEAKAKVETEVAKASEIKTEVVKEMVMEQTAIRLAAQGLTEDKLPPVSKVEPLTPDNIHQQFMAMEQGKERSEFYKKHKAVLQAPRASLKL